MITITATEIELTYITNEWQYDNAVYVQKALQRYVQSVEFNTGIDIEPTVYFYQASRQIVFKAGEDRLIWLKAPQDFVRLVDHMVDLMELTAILKPS